MENVKHPIGLRLVFVAETKNIPYVCNIFVGPTLINRTVTLQNEDSELMAIELQLVEE